MDKKTPAARAPIQKKYRVKQPELGQFIKAQRMAVGWTQEELFLAVNRVANEERETVNRRIPQSWLQDVEQGQVQYLYSDRLFLLALALGIHPIQFSPFLVDTHPQPINPIDAMMTLRAMHPMSADTLQRVMEVIESQGDRPSSSESDANPARDHESDPS